MKKTILLLAVSAAFFAGCTNENSENPVPAASVVIKGNILADIETEDGAGNEAPLELVEPEDQLTVYFVNAESGALLDFVVTSTGTYEKTLQIPQLLDIEIFVSDFEVERRIFKDGSYKGVLFKYTRGENDTEEIAQVKPNFTYLRDVFLNDGNFEEVEFDN